MSLASIKDQEVALRLLRGIIRHNRIPNGLLFWGPQGVGKNKAAHEFAKALNCQERQEDACDTCLPCRKIQHGNHPDVVRIRPEGKTRTIRTKAIDGVNEMVVFRPYEGGVRIVIIEEADRMNEAAQNHFLKTLEEPVSRTTFLLLSERPRDLLPTIRSRCQRIRFSVLRPATIAHLLVTEKNIEPEKAETIAALSFGSMTRALNLIETERRQVVVTIVKQLAEGKDPLELSEAFALHIQNIEKRITESIVEKKAPVDGTQEEEEEYSPDKEERDALVAGLVRQELLEYLILFDSWYRDALVASATGNTALLYNRDADAWLSKEVNTVRLSEKLQHIAEAWIYLERNLNKARIFRDLFFTLAS